MLILYVKAKIAPIAELYFVRITDNWIGLSQVLFPLCKRII